jgi:CRP/FNR family transcriptional regulator, anaerobic regulatory protein
MSPSLLERLSASYPVLDRIDPSARSAVLAEAQLARVPAGALLFEEGTPCQGFPMMLSGSVRVARGSPGGRSLVDQRCLRPS